MESIKKEVKFLTSIYEFQYSNYCHNYVAAQHFVETVALQPLHATFCVMSEGLLQKGVGC